MVEGVFTHSIHRPIAQPQLERLKRSKLDTPEGRAAFSQRFDEGVKKTFSVSNGRADQYVEFSCPRDNDPNCQIKGWRLKLTG